MTVRWSLLEKEILAPQAAFSLESKGRLREEEACPIRTCYQQDRDRIIHSKAFRRLKDKTQVFIAPYGDHYRTRLTHTLEVMQISRTIARALQLNEDLTEAIAMGHDLGHTPFGHAGERSLAEITGHFRHNEQSLRVVDFIEKNGKGLNLTEEVRDGILNHSGHLSNQTLEGAIVQISDRIAYVNHDIDDAIRAKLIEDKNLPLAPREVLGFSGNQRINSLVTSVIHNSQALEKITLGQKESQALDELREYLFREIYHSKQAMLEEAKLKLEITALFNYYLCHLKQVPSFFLEFGDAKQAVCDYIAGMSDYFAFQQFALIGIS